MHRSDGRRLSEIVEVLVAGHSHGRRVAAPSQSLGKAGHCLTETTCAGKRAELSGGDQNVHETPGSGGMFTLAASRRVPNRRNEPNRLANTLSAHAH